MDVFRERDSVLLWMKTKAKDLLIRRSVNVSIFLQAVPLAKEFLVKNKIKFTKKRKKTYYGPVDVYEIKIINFYSFERFVLWIERETKHRVPIYNADIKPELSFLFQNDLLPLSEVWLKNGSMTTVDRDCNIFLKNLNISIISGGDVYKDSNTPIVKIITGDKEFKQKKGYNEKIILMEFAEFFESYNPDVLSMAYGYSRLPYLDSRLKKHGIKCRLHRWSDAPIKYRGGKSFFSYGSVRYQDFSVKLRGRFLVDTSTMAGHECGIEGFIELCQLSGNLFQNVVSRSFGAAFQSALVREMVKQNYIVPYKEKPIEIPVRMHTFVKTDRVGYTYDPIVGFHKNVAEIDFSSMYPWVIYNHNISAETVRCSKGPFEKVPGLPLKISLRKKGLVPIAIKGFLDRRMYYKRNPTIVNKKKAAGLKWVLVSSYGYCRFREFKLGLAGTHMAIGAFARETLLESAKVAEGYGYKILHGIIDSLYIQKKGINEEDIDEFCEELQLLTGIPVESEGIFKWIVFLPSVNNPDRPVPTRYFGVYKNGEIKARGIEVRQKSAPIYIKKFQEMVIEMIAKCDNEYEIRGQFDNYCTLLRRFVMALPNANSSHLISRLQLTKTDYEKNIPQKAIVNALRKKGYSVMPGMVIRFIMTNKGPVLPENFNTKLNSSNMQDSNSIDVSYYKKSLSRALFSIMQPFGYSREDIKRGADAQKKIPDFDAKSIYIQKSQEVLCVAESQSQSQWTY